MKYKVKAKIDQIVTKEIHMDIQASTEEEAKDIATSALGEYPEPVTDGRVLKMVTKKAHFWIPKTIEFVEITREKNSA